MNVGILALQGCVDPHKEHLRALGCEVKEVRLAEDLQNLDGLILPGGESTTMLKLIDTFQMKDALLEAAKRMPFWGICAGCILLADQVQNPSQNSFHLLNISVRRNAYGRQQESFEIALNPSSQETVAFIRAPQILQVGEGVQVVAKHADQAVWVESQQHMACTFHPELSSTVPSSAHTHFVNKIRHYKS